MPYTLQTIIKLLPSDTGLTLKAQLVDADGSDNGAEVTTGFTELGGGEYAWTYAGFPDDFRGYVKILSGSSTYQTAFPVNPEDAETINAVAATALSTQSAVLDTQISLSAIAGAGFDSGQHSLEALRDRGDAAWTTGSGADAVSIRQEIDANSTQLAAIKAKTDIITSEGISVSLGSNIAEDGITLTIIQGEAMLDALNSALSIDITDSRLTSAITSDGTVPVLRIAGGGAKQSFNGTVESFDDETDTATCTWDLTAAQTGALPAGIGNKWELDWLLAGSSTNVITSVIDAPCTVKRQIAT